MNRHIPIDAAVRFLWHDRQGGLHMGLGTTRDLYHRGIFVLADQSPALGVEVQLLVDLALGDGGHEGRLMGKGVVVRSESTNNQAAGFAAEVLFQPGWACLFGDAGSFELASWKSEKADVPAWIPEVPVHAMAEAVA